jgi:hypothetical protein
MDEVTAALRNIRKSVVEYNETSNMPRAVVGQIADLQECMTNYQREIPTHYGVEFYTLNDAVADFKKALLEHFGKEKKARDFGELLKKVIIAFKEVSSECSAREEEYKKKGASDKAARERQEKLRQAKEKIAELKKTAEATLAEPAPVARRRDEHEEIELCKKMEQLVQAFVGFVEARRREEDRFSKFSSSLVRFVDVLRRSESSHLLNLDALNDLVADLVRKSKSFIFSHIGEFALIRAAARRINETLIGFRKQLGESFVVTEEKVGAKVATWKTVASPRKVDVPDTWDEMQNTGVLYGDGHNISPEVVVLNPPRKGGNPTVNSMQRSHNQPTPAPVLTPEKKSDLLEIEAILNNDVLISDHSTPKKDYDKFLELQQKTQNKKKVEKDQKSEAYRSKVQTQNSEKEKKEQDRAKEREQQRRAAAAAHEKAKSDRRNQIDATLPHQIGGFKKI